MDISELTLNDLASMVAIIDQASISGVFKGVDLKGVGILREKLVDIIKKNKQEE